ncbi:hypothetical protein AcW2_006925 [Taiwanofungus camphoratus]|nr:hypothetical protein AcW2_006925 [Antrodia cinnamomea]
MSTAQTRSVTKVHVALVESLQMHSEGVAESSDYVGWAQTFGKQLGTWQLILQGVQLPADPQIETEVEEVIKALLPASEVRWLKWADEVFPELAVVIQGQEEEHWAAEEANTAENVQDPPVVLRFPTVQAAPITQEESSSPHRSSHTRCPIAPGTATSVSELVLGSTVVEATLVSHLHTSKGKECAAPKVLAKVAVWPQKEINSATAWANYQEQDLGMWQDCTNIESQMERYHRQSEELQHLEVFLIGQAPRSLTQRAPPLWLVESGPSTAGSSDQMKLDLESEDEDVKV